MPTGISENIFTYIESVYGSEAAKKFEEYSGKAPEQFIRVNTKKISVEKLALILEKKYSIRSEPVPFVNNALKIFDEENLVGKTLEQILGFYYIQSYSSMLPPVILNPSGSDKVLDLCSAPGSKTTQMAEMMNNEGTLVVNEVDLSRIRSLAFNLDRMNVVNAGIIHSKGELLSKIYSNYFDRILVDAPCSGLGIVQKKDEINKWWSLKHVERLHDLQVRLLVSAVKMLKPGGKIVYSTCTLTVEENELVVEKILAKYPVEITPVNFELEHVQGFKEYNGKKINPQLSNAVRILPWHVDSEGFFLIKLTKTEATDISEKLVTKPSTFKFVTAESKEMEPYVTYLSEHFGIDKNVFDMYKYIMRPKDIFMIDKNWDDPNPANFHRMGTKLGTFDKKRRITIHSQGAQILGEHATKHVYHLKNDDEVKTYLTGWRIKDIEIPIGQYIIKLDDDVLGSALMLEDGLKSRFPKTKRTQRFII